MKTMLLLFTLAITINTIAQSPVLEKTYDVSGKAKRGFLAGVEYNKEKETFDMYYMVSSFFEGAGYSHSSVWGSGMNGDIPCEVYSYDKDLNEKGNSKVGVRPDSYQWANFKGYFTYDVVQGWFDLGGLAFKKMRNTYRYDPQTGEYRISQMKAIDKEKPKQSDGTKYSFMGGYEIYNVTAEKSALMILGKKIEKSDATKKNNLHWYNHLMKYDIVHCDFDMNITVADSFGFESVTQKIFSGQIKDQRNASNDEIARDWVLIYGSRGKTPLYQNLKPTEWTYLRISPQGKIKEKIQFESPSNYWRVDGVYEKDNVLYLYGPAFVGEPDKFLKVKDGIDLSKYTHYQIAKISNGKFDFLKAYSLKDMQAQMKKPASQKKLLELTGNEQTTGITILNNGDMFFCHQNMEKGIYRNMFIFHVDASGELKKNYGIELTEIKAKDDYLDALSQPTKNYFYPSGDGKSLYWFIASPKEMACAGTKGADYSTYHCWALRGIDYTTINFETGELSEMKTIGNEKKNPFYLFASEMVEPMNAGNNVYFFSENEKGSNIRLTRIDISK